MANQVRCRAQVETVGKTGVEMEALTAVQSGLEVPRATVYRRLSAKVPEDAGAEDLLLCRLIGEEYTVRPFYGSRHGFCAQRATWSTISACSA